jgi:hypothetical protein
VIGLSCVFFLSLTVSLILRYYVKNIFKKRHAFNEMSLVGSDDNSLGTLSSSFDSIVPCRMPLTQIEPIFKPMLCQQNDLKLIKRSCILLNPVYNVESNNDELFTDIYITNPNQEKLFFGPNYDRSGIKPVENSSKTWEQLQNEKSLKNDLN